VTAGCAREFFRADIEKFVHFYAAIVLCAALTRILGGTAIAEAIARGTLPLESSRVISHACETTIFDWLQLIRAEYLEIPDLHLTRQQAQRLWGLDEMTCDALLDVLTRARFLRQTRTGGYVRAD